MDSWLQITLKSSLCPLPGPRCVPLTLGTLGIESLPLKDMIIYFHVCFFHLNFDNHEERYSSCFMECQQGVLLYKS